jgi:thiamine pyrophosphokinase
MPAEESQTICSLNPSSAGRGGIFLRAVIFANGQLNDLEAARAALQAGDLLIAADGGALHCRRMGLTPSVVIGDFDSLSEVDLQALELAGANLVRYPERKDFTDLELALRYAAEEGAGEILVLGGLGSRWDQTVANLLLPAAAGFESSRIRLLDGSQEILLIRDGETLALSGEPGDIVSLVPLGGEARGVVTIGLEYPLHGETLAFGSSRGISNVIHSPDASVTLEQGLLLCVLIRVGKEAF